MHGLVVERVGEEDELFALDDSLTFGDGVGVAGRVTQIQ